jgi:hypothetical protein
MSDIGQTPRATPLPFGHMASIAVVGAISCLMVIDALTHAQPLVLPLISATLTGIGFTWAAAIALRRRRSEAPLSDRLVWPSLIVFFGLAAAMLSDAEQLVKHLQIH